MKNKNSDLLEQIHIATPCNESWSRMTGTERAKFCGKCKLHVYNLSAMTRAEAERFVLDAKGPSCIRLYKRSDGTVLTNDCRGRIADAYYRVKLFAIGSSIIATIINWFGGMGFTVMNGLGPVIGSQTSTKP